MPVVVMHGGSGAAAAGGNCTLSSKSTGPDSHLCLAVVAAVINPPIGLVALLFSCWSRHKAAMDWDGAYVRGRVAMWLAVTAIVTIIAILVVFVLVYYTKDT